MKRVFVAVILTVWMFLVGVIPVSADSKNVELEIQQMESRRFQAMVKVDTHELNRILADDLTYTHSNGEVDSKAQLIASLNSGERKYESIQPEDVKVRVYKEAAVITGRASMKTKSKGKDYSFQIRFIDVYVKKGKSWQMVAWQSTRLPEQ